jgi:single-stranded-DNA-specific exonuclease
MRVEGEGDWLWVYPAVNPQWSSAIGAQFRLHPITAQILAGRGFSNLEQVHQFLYGKLPDLIDPYLLPDMDTAVHRVHAAISQKQRILVYGDNDVDGMTGTALLVDFLRSVGADVAFYIPNPNVTSQAGLNEALELALQRHCRLIITVDCGISGAGEIALISEKNIDVIVTDHHEPTGKWEHCVATLNPKLINSQYPNRDLTGVGVAFKLVHAMASYLGSIGLVDLTTIDLRQYLDLVALGTVADMGALVGENRILVRYGLQELRLAKRVGITQLAKVAELDLSRMTAGDIASKLAPRMNSLGRVDDPQKGVELLLQKRHPEAELLAQELDLHNVQRQRLEQQMSEQVMRTLETQPEILKDKAIVLASTKWHPGVVPIVSARVAKRYHRPSAMICVVKGIGKGSLRTISKFPLLPALRQQADLLLNFGGHDYAAGLAIKEENIPEFTRRFTQLANETLSDMDVIPTLQLDARADFSQLTFDLMDSLELLEPFGAGNPQPVLYCRARQARPPKVVGQHHLKFYLEQGDRLLEGIGFGMAQRRAQKDWMQTKDQWLEVAYCPQVTTYQRKPSIQLIIRDVRPASTTDGG